MAWGSECESGGLAITLRLTTQEVERLLVQYGPVPISASRQSWCTVFAGVFPEDKFRLVQALQIPLVTWLVHAAQSAPIPHQPAFEYRLLARGSNF